MKTYAQFQKYNPFRQPNWRFERVLSLVNRIPAGRCSRRDDDWVRRARPFLLAWESKDADDDREELYLQEPDLYYAYKLYQTHLDPAQSGPMKILEARLLARQTNEEIALSLSTTPDAIAWYEALFFNVADRLDNRDWITSQVLIPALLDEYKPDDDETKETSRTKRGIVADPLLDRSLKMFAYFGGSHLVDIMINGFQHGKQVTGAEDLSKWFDHNFGLSIRRRSHQAALQFEVNRYNVMELFHVHAELIKIEKAQDSAENQRTTVERHIKAMLDELPWATGDEGEQVAAYSNLKNYDAKNVELRDDQLLQASANEPVEGIEQIKPRARVKKKLTLEETTTVL